MTEHTENRMQKHWATARTFIKEKWPQFTDVQLDRINGNYDLFNDYLKEYYGGFPLTEATARAQLKKLFDALDEKYFEDQRAS